MISGGGGGALPSFGPVGQCHILKTCEKYNLNDSVTKRSLILHLFQTYLPARCFRI